MRKLLYALIFQLLAIPAIADGTYKSAGFGLVKCSDVYSDIIEDDIHEPYVIWMSGFLTAYSLILSREGDLLGDLNINDLKLKIVDYCKNNMEDHLSDYGGVLVQELIKENLLIK